MIRFVRPGGQATIESALVLPLMVALVLGLLQLALIEQARLMTEYAAFQAARAGIVWNGNSERMHDAALLALLPTMGRTDGWSALAATWQRQRRADAQLQSLPWGVAKTEVNGQSLTGRLRVDTITPSSAAASHRLWKAEVAHELDFDGVQTYPESPALEQHLERFFDLRKADPDEVAYREATLLQIRLRYWYELQVPFASQVIFLAWYATNADVALFGAIDRSTTARQNALGSSGDARALKLHGKGLAGVQPSEMFVLWDLAFGALPPRRVFLPLQATHSMRLQSSFFEKWQVH